MGCKSKSKRAGFRGTQWHLIDRTVGRWQNAGEASPSSRTSRESVSEQSAAGISAQKLADAPSSWSGPGALPTSSPSDFTSLPSLASPFF